MKTLKQEIIEKLLNEVDEDIREILMREEKQHQLLPTYKGYELLEDPGNTIIGWQMLRNSKDKDYETKREN